MVRLIQIPMIRAVAQAALEQNMLTPNSYLGVVEWIDRLEHQNRFHSEDQAIRKASEMMIRRLRQSVSTYWSGSSMNLPEFEMAELQAVNAGEHLL